MEIYDMHYEGQVRGYRADFRTTDVSCLRHRVLRWDIPAAEREEQSVRAQTRTLLVDIAHYGSNAITYRASVRLGLPIIHSKTHQKQELLNHKTHCGEGFAEAGISENILGEAVNENRRLIVLGV